MANTKCKECGCVCPKCMLDHDVHLHLEIENLKQQLIEKHNHIVTMETNFLNEANKYPNGELLALHDELLTWQDKYKRLYDAHRRIQRVNQGLEDKLLRLVDVSETDKSTLTKDIATLSYKLAEANYAIKKLTEDNERYKNDVSVAIQFLQCKPGNFVSQKFDTLPNEVQAKVSTYMGGKRKTDEKRTPPEIKSIKVPIPTFPPTAMVYSVPKSQAFATREEKEPEPAVDIVSAAIMAKVLEERARERSCIKHCDTCTCSNQLKIIHNTTHHSIATQTHGPHGAQSDSLCLQCNNKLERAAIQIVKGVGLGVSVGVGVGVGVSSVEPCKNKAMPVYIHDFTESSAPVSANVAKVQPNNFLTDSSECSKLRKETANSTNKLGILRPLRAKPDLVSSVSSVSSVADLIDLGAPEESNEMLYFANERAHKKAHKVKTHERSKPLTVTVNSLVSPPPPSHSTHKTQSYPKVTHSKSLLLHSCNDDFRQILVATSPRGKASSLSSGDHSEMTSSEPTNTNSASDFQRVEEWMDSMNMVETAAVESTCGTDCSSLVSSHGPHGANKIDLEVEIDTTKYKEMEDHVKKFLLGEYTLLSDD